MAGWLNIEAPAEGGRGGQLEAQHPDQGRMLDQILAQFGHVALPLVDLDQVGGNRQVEPILCFVFPSSLVLYTNRV
jgi:hypothetical protein